MDAHEITLEEIKCQFEPAVPQMWCSPLAEAPPAEDPSTCSMTCLFQQAAPLAIFLLLPHLTSAWNLEADLGPDFGSWRRRPDLSASAMAAARSLDNSLGWVHSQEPAPDAGPSGHPRGAKRCRSCSAQLPAPGKWCLMSGCSSAGGLTLTCLQPSPAVTWSAHQLLTQFAVEPAENFSTERFLIQ